MFKKITAIIYTLCILAIGFSGAIFFSTKFENTGNKYLTASVNQLDLENIIINEKNSNNEINLYFTGDIMLTRGVKISVEKNFGGNYDKLFENLEELKEADILFGNLEGPISDKGNNVGSKYSFRMEPKTLVSLKNAGFDIFSFANNHVSDWNINAFKDTLQRFNDVGIYKTGAGLNKKEAIDPVIIEKNEVKFGFLGFTDVGPNWLQVKENSAGILLASDPLFAEIIKNAKAKCDVLIVSFHWGEEYQKIHNYKQEKLAHLAIDSGADLIIGHHPHVIQDIETYKNKPIVYSLGNLIFDQYFSKDTMQGMIFKATFIDNVLVSTEKKLVQLNRLYQPEKIIELKEEPSLAVEERGSCPVPNKKFTDMSFLNIGPNNPLPEKSYIPNNLVQLNKEISKNETFCLVKEVKEAFVLMQKEAEKDNIFLKITSAYRSYNTQSLLVAERQKYTQQIERFLAKAGHSEHQLGMAIDISGKSISYGSTNSKFQDTIESKWLEENAYKYGFVMSYPRNKEKITGYIFEPWHYRYVGIEIAKDIKEKNITLTEYLGSINR